MSAHTAEHACHDTLHGEGVVSAFSTDSIKHGRTPTSTSGAAGRWSAPQQRFRVSTGSRFASYQHLDGLYFYVLKHTALRWTRPWTATGLQNVMLSGRPPCLTLIPAHAVVEAPQAELLELPSDGGNRSVLVQLPERTWGPSPTLPAHFLPSRTGMHSDLIITSAFASLCCSDV